MMHVVRGYKTELDLNNAQRTACLKHAGCARFTYNWGLARSQEVYRTTGKRPTAIDLHKELNHVFICEECGMVMDRDLNAARNIRIVAVSSIDTRNACGQNSAGFLATGSETVLEEAGTTQHYGVSRDV